MTASGWVAAPLKRWVSVRPSNVDKLTADGETAVRLCNYVDVYKNERITDDMDLMLATASEAQIERFTLKRHDVIVTKDSETPDDIGVPAHVPADLPGVVCGYHLSLLRSDANRLHGGFLFWALQSSNAHDYFATSALGITRYALNTADIEQFPLFAPGLADQVRIANFLDDKTARIDALIAEKERLVERLQEYRKSRITEAITKGLNPAVSSKPSGIEWLGSIPSHWQMRKLKHLGSALIGLTYSPADVVDEGQGTLVLRSSNVQQGRITLGDNVFVTTEIPTQLRVIAGDILVCSRNGSRALIGKNATIDANSEGLTFGAFMTVFRSPFNYFLRWALNSHLFDFQSASFFTSTINQLTTGNLNNFDIPFPPEKERKEIAENLVQKFDQIDCLLMNADNHIARLREYRSSLISAAVTGQIDIGAYGVNQ